jgi:hypothetical protein
VHLIQDVRRSLVVKKIKWQKGIQSVFKKSDYHKNRVLFAQRNQMVEAIRKNSDEGYEECELITSITIQTLDLLLCRCHIETKPCYMVGNSLSLLVILLLLSTTYIGP